MKIPFTDFFDSDNHNKTETIALKQEIVLKGIPCSRGLAFAKAVVIEPEQITIVTDSIPIEKIPSELNRLESALKDLEQKFLAILDKVKDESSNVVAVLETNLIIITDPTLGNSLRKRISDGFSVEAAVIQEFDKQKQFLKRSKDPIFRERTIELDHIMESLLGILKHKFVQYDISSDNILVAKSITPTDLVNMHESKLAGLITEVGGIASHSAILARSFEIPAIINVKDSTQIIKNDDYIILDGYSGTCYINPTQVTIAKYLEKKNKEEEHLLQLGKLAKLTTKTIDGRKIKLYANADFPDEVKAAELAGAEGIGLVRSENLAMLKGKFPSEDEQYEWYKQLSERAYPNHVTIRAFDVGSDKFSQGLPKHEANPQLGFRGIRFLLYREDIFISQINAILRASVTKNLRFMLPMITSISEVEQTHVIIDNCKRILSEKNIPFDDKLPIGIMIETPSAAIISDSLAKYVQFFSIGTNDLTQYVLAADRTNENLAELFDSFHPAVIKLIKMTIEGAKKHKIPVAMCGELAGHAAATELLIGLGIDELSVPPPILLDLKSRILEASYKKSKKLANEILQLDNFNDIRKKLGIR